MKGITIFSVVGNLHRRKADLNYMQIFLLHGWSASNPCIVVLSGKGCGRG